MQSVKNQMRAVDLYLRKINKCTKFGMQFWGAKCYYFIDCLLVLTCWVRYRCVHK